MSTDLKHTAGKLPWALLFEAFPHALGEVVEVLAHGNEKYVQAERARLAAETTGMTLAEIAAAIPNVNWHGSQPDTYESAGLRHKAKRWIEGGRDSDSGLRHRAHEAWNALAALELEIRREGDLA